MIQITAWPDSVCLGLLGKTRSPRAAAPGCLLETRWQHGAPETTHRSFRLSFCGLLPLQHETAPERDAPHCSLLLWCVSQGLLQSFLPSKIFLPAVLLEKLQ